jgi:hypothetical protein
VAFSVSQQPAVVYSPLPHYFAVSHSEDKQVDVRPGSVAFGVISLNNCAHKAAAFGSKRRQATADLLLREALRMLESDGDDSSPCSESL